MKMNGGTRVPARSRRVRYSSNPVIPGIRISHRTTATSLSRRTCDRLVTRLCFHHIELPLLQQPHDQRPDPPAHRPPPGRTADRALVAASGFERRRRLVRITRFGDVSWTGSTSRKTAPRSAGTSSSVPPCADAMPCEIERPSPVPFADRFGGEERLEDPPAQLFVDSAAVVRDLERAEPAAQRRFGSSRRHLRS